MSLSTNSSPTESSCSSCTSAVPQYSPEIEGTVSDNATEQYKDFSFKLRQKVAAERIPINGSIEIIENCYFRCIHCY